MEYIERLNAAQRRAVTAPLHPMLVLAGPGTGKTRTLVSRIIYLIRHHNIPPHRMLAVTFTNKAKEEMKHRLREQLGDAASDLKVGTFHRFCMTVLREQHEAANLPKQFTIADEPTQLLTLARVSHIQDAKSLSTVLSAISSYRLNRANLNLTFQGIAEKWIGPYHQELQKNRLIDFDQILLFTQTLFTQHPELVDAYQQKFDAILVDEFQDTDPVQYGIMKALAWQHRNIFVVADDDQSIFAWRGAHIENIEQFTDEFECRDEQVIILTENYRSDQEIIDLATRLINQGPRFREKRISAVAELAKSLSNPPAFLLFPDDEAEMQFIVKRITALTSKDEQAGSQPPPLRCADIAILYPTHAIGDHLEAKLLAAHIPCQLIKRQGMFDQLAVRKILLLLKLLHNPQDDLALEQYFQLELNNEQVFEQIRKLKERRTCKQTLAWLDAARSEVEGISRSVLSKAISATFGIVTNMLTYLQEHSEIRLPELINQLCNLIAPDQTITIHSCARRLADPFEIPGLPDVVSLLCQEQSAKRTIVVRGADAKVAAICQACLNAIFPIGKSQAVKFSENECHCEESATKHPSLAPLAGMGFSESDPPGVVKARQPGWVSLSTPVVESSRHRVFPGISAGNPYLSALAPSPNLGEGWGGVEIASQSLAMTDRKPIFLDLNGIAETTLFAHQAGADDTPTITIVPAEAKDSQTARPPLHLTIASPFSPVVTVFKLCQALTTARIPKAFRKYTVFDLETTSNDTRTTRIVEIGAVKVEDGKIIGEFGRLVNPEQPITQGAAEVHHIAEADVRDQPTFAELLPEFLAFIGDDILVAHNGLSFDFPIFMRQYKEATGQTFTNRRFDTLPLARRLFPGEGASVDKLLERFGIPTAGERHRALDDTRFLAQIFEQLQIVERSLNCRSEHEELLELVALGLYWQAISDNSQLPIENCELSMNTDEERVLFQLGARKLLSRFSELPAEIQALAEPYKFDIEHVLADLAEDESSEKTTTFERVFSGREVALAHLKDVAETFKTEPLQEAIPHFLDHAALYNSQDELRDINAVNLLTIHSAKGLEFPVVFIAGVEKGNLPSFYSVREDGELGQKKIDEQRRLFYVAMTRAKQQLYVTYVNKRGEYEKKRSQFLIELGIESDEMVGKK